MASNKNFFDWLDNVREKIDHRRENYLFEQNQQAHNSKDLFSSDTSRKVVEAFVAPPSFLLYLWAAFPLLLVATFQTSAIIAGVIATTINFLLIHMDTYNFVRYLLCGIILTIAIVLYHWNVI